MVDSLIARAAFAAAALALPATAQAAAYPTSVAPIEFGKGVYVQDFDTLASTGKSSALPAGFQAYEQGDNANSVLTAANGSNNAGDIYSFGENGSTERALGSIRSGNLTTAMYGAFFTNVLDSVIDGLSIAYTGEQWRNGSASADSLAFEYSLDATSLLDGNWISVPGLTFNSVVGGAARAIDGNAAANKTALNATIEGLNIAGGSNFAIRWIDRPVSSGAQDGLAIDNLSIAASRLTGAVPEPGTWLMMIVGFGFAGGAMRRRRSMTVIVA